MVTTGVANLASVLAAFDRMQVKASLIDTADSVRRADRVVLPGVGTFGAAMDELRRLELQDALYERLQVGRATLTICLGLQLLAVGSEESPGVAGLGVVNCTATRFAGGSEPDAARIRVPQMGWNEVIPTADARFVRPGFAYFANTFKLDHLPTGWAGATAEHGGSFVAALERENVLACQFHPELSGAWGAELLRRWVATC